MLGETTMAVLVLAVPSDRLRENARRIADHLAAWNGGCERDQGTGAAHCVANERGAGGGAAAGRVGTPRSARCRGRTWPRRFAQGKPAIHRRGFERRTKAAETGAGGVAVSARFRVYTSNDLTGVELAGSLKNIVALGAGICDGLEVGENAKAAFIARALAEIARLGVAAGAQPLTFAGLAGVGDVIATCASRLSRNRHVGEQLALGRSWPEIRDSMDNVAEGVNATGAALKLAEKLDVEMPIAQTTYRVLHEGLPPLEAAVELMQRPVGSEW